MIVVFDTTVLFTDVHASRPLTEQVLRRALEEGWEVVVPQVVVQEAVRQYPIRLAELLAASQRDIKKFRTAYQAFGMTPPTVPDVDIDTLVEEYEPALRELLSQDPCSIAEHPPGSEQVGTWAATRRAPFKEDGSGTCDAFVWLTALSLARRDSVVLVSANSTDFADPADATQLHPELRADLEAAGHAADRVRRVPNLHELVAEFVTPAERALARARAILDDPGVRATLISRISFDASWSPSEWDSTADWELGVDVEQFELRAFDADELEIEGAEEVDGGALVMLLRARGTGSFDFYVEKSEIVHAPDGSPVEVWDSDWNDQYVWAQASLPATAEIEARTQDGQDFAIAINDLEPGV